MAFKAEKIFITSVLVVSVLVNDVLCQDIPVQPLDPPRRTTPIPTIPTTTHRIVTIPSRRPTLIPTYRPIQPTSNGLCNVGITEPVYKYYYSFGRILRVVVQCCRLCCYTKHKSQPICKNIEMYHCGYGY